MSPTPTSATQATVAPPPAAPKQKLKLSCDSCASLKVACPKQQPECERCISKGRRCTYSLACRNGKRKQNKLQDPTKSLPSPPERQIWPTPSPLALPDNEDPLASRGGNLNTAIIPELPELVTNNLPASLNDTLSFTTNSLHEALWQPADHPMNSVEAGDSLTATTPYQEVSMYQHPYSYFPSYVRPTRWPRQRTSPLFTPPASYRGEASGESTPSSGSACSFSPTAELDANFLMNNELPNIHPVPQDNCFARTYLFLDTLKRPMSNVCMFEPNDIHSMYLQNSISESIDKILMNTDKAVEHVTSVLKCSCSSTSSVRCALMLVMSEVISWYETIVRELNQQGEKAMRESSPWSGCDDGDFSAKPKNINPFSLVSIPNITIGGMTLPPADARSVVIHVMLSRVRSVRGTVQTLSKDCNLSMEGVERLDTVTKEFVKMQKAELNS